MINAKEEFLKNDFIPLLGKLILPILNEGERLQKWRDAFTDYFATNYTNLHELFDVKLLTNLFR